jgi:orotidine-5'-phosphate decarboxylase
LDLLFPPLKVAKIGLELFVRNGPKVFEMLKRPGVEFFLDLKLHDIPHTVSQAIEAVRHLPIRFLTVHACGGYAMLKAAQEATQGSPIQLLAVTLLTSLDERQVKAIFLGTESIADQVVRLAEIAAEAGLRGFVCSPQEIRHLRSALGDGVTLVTPGIRTGVEMALKDDQMRTFSAHEALDAGADYLVIGRPITQAASPQEALARLLETP